MESWVGDQEISIPLQSDAAKLAERLEWVDALVHAHCGGSSMCGKSSDLDLLQRLVDDGVLKKDDTYHLQSLGLVLGQVLVNESGFHWVTVEDKFGRDPAIKFGTTSVLVFPLTMISKRVERGDRPDIHQLVKSLLRDLPRYVSESTPKPG